MSYTKLNQEIEKYLKANNLPWIGTSEDSKEETDYRLKVYDEGRDVIFNKWLSERKYKELISCVHAGWFSEEVLLIPLAEYLAKENEPDYLKFLCEKKIRSSIENTISALNSAKNVQPTISLEDILAVDLEKYAKSKTYNHTAAVAKFRVNALKRLDSYIALIEHMHIPEYLETIKNIRRKTDLLQIKKADLKDIKYKL